MNQLHLFACDALRFRTMKILSLKLLLRKKNPYLKDHFKMLWLYLSESYMPHHYFVSS